MNRLAPEQVEGREADARTDIWALGVLIYEMVTGTRPFHGDTPASVIGSILKDDPRPLKSLSPLVPAALDRIVSNCLTKDPDARWQSASQDGVIVYAPGFGEGLGNLRPAAPRSSCSRRIPTEWSPLPSREALRIARDQRVSRRTITSPLPSCAPVATKIMSRETATSRAGIGVMNEDTSLGSASELRSTIATPSRPSAT